MRYKINSTNVKYDKNNNVFIFIIKLNEYEDMNLGNVTHSKYMK